MSRAGGAAASRVTRDGAIEMTLLHGGDTYDATALICHHSTSAEPDASTKSSAAGGHYTAFVRNPTSSWFFFNDSCAGAGGASRAGGYIQRVAAPAFLQDFVPNKDDSLRNSVSAIVFTKRALVDAAVCTSSRFPAHI